MNYFAQLEMNRIHHAELCRAADRHRLVTAARRSRHRRGIAHLLQLLTRPAPRRLRGVAEAESCRP